MIGLRTATGTHRHYGLRVLAGLIALLVLSAAESAAGVLRIDEWLLFAVFAGASLMTVYELTPLTIEGLARPVLVAAALDMLVFLSSGLAIVGSLAERQAIVVPDATIAVLVCLVTMLAWAATSATIVFVRGVRLTFGGPYFMFGGLSLVAIAGASLVASDASTRLGLTGPTDFAFAVGAVMIARGWLTWSLEAAERRRAWLVELGRDIVSTSAIIVAIFVTILDPDTAPETSRLGTVGHVALLVGVVAAGVRQIAINEYERRARVAGALTSARLVTEISERGRVSRALEGVEPGTTVTATAERICARLMRLPFADFAVITCLDGEHAGTPLAAAGLVGRGLVGSPLEAAQAERLCARANGGVWVEPADAWLGPWVPPGPLVPSPTAVHAPLLWDDRLVGILTVGACDGDDDAGARHESATREAAVLAAALLGPALAAGAAMRLRREQIDELIAERQFYPVFQPIVELASERILGFEALTRFEDGARPDIRFSEAAAVGRGTELEVATLAAAVEESSLLPAECYLSLNLSGGLASTIEVLGPVLTPLKRNALLEITEHVPVEDYERMMATLYALDIRIRIAVDDAGAGYAGLQHILAIRPHVVKLDAALVRSVDLDLARQAIVGAMVSFASRTGCTIVAEGVETRSEAAMLRTLGVVLAQGYLFGRPRRAAEWSEELASRPAARP